MKKVKLLVALGVCGLVLGACGDKKVEEKGNATAVKESEVSSVESAAESSKELPEGVEARTLFSTDWTEDWHDTTFKITEVSVVQYSDPEAIEFTDSEYMVGVNFSIQNNGDHAISAYPDQGIAIINGKQYDADMMLSDSIGGDIIDGSTVEGVVVFAVPDLTSVDDVTELRLTWPADDFEDTTNMDDTSKDFDVTLELKK